MDFKSRPEAARRSRAIGDESSQESPSENPKRSRWVLVSVVVVALLAVSIAYYEYSAYGHTVISTTIVSGTITKIVTTSPPSTNNYLAGIGGSAASAGASLVTISVGKVSFTQVVPCSPVSGYTVGQTLQVADQLLRSGAHSYAPDVGCKGSLSPFEALHLTQTATSTA